VMRQSMEGHDGVEVNRNFTIGDLEYADDVVILGKTIDEVQSVLDRVGKYAAEIGLRVNVDKTKYFTNGIDSNQPLTIYGSPIGNVECFNYLGSSILPDGGAIDEIDTRINKARGAFIQLSKALWKRNEISIRTKTRIYQAAIRSVLLYGCESWPVRASDMCKLEVFDHWCLRILAKVKYNDRLSNEQVRKKCFDIESIRSYTIRRRLQWFGHVLRRDNGETIREVLFSEPCATWKARVGGQQKTWLSTVKTDMEKLCLYKVYGIRRWNKDWLSICSDMASSRVAWAATIRDILKAD